jgi:hypothetical protein
LKRQEEKKGGGNGGKRKENLEEDGRAEKTYQTRAVPEINIRTYVDGKTDNPSVSYRSLNGQIEIYDLRIDRVIPTQFRGSL